MKMTKVFGAVLVLGLATSPTKGWSQTVDVFPSFGADKEVVSGADENFRGVGECTTFAYAISGIPNKVKVNGAKTETTMGNAYQWISNAQKRGYQTSPNPQSKSVGVIGIWQPIMGLVPKLDSKGKPMTDKKGKTVMVTGVVSAGGPNGHVYWVNSTSKGPTYFMDIRHDNWGSNPKDAIWSSGQVQIHGGRWLTSLGFITKW